MAATAPIERAGDSLYGGFLGDKATVADGDLQAIRLALNTEDSSDMVFPVSTIWTRAFGIFGFEEQLGGVG